MQFKLVSLNMRSIASVFLVSLFLVSGANAARISKVKGDQVLIDGVDSEMSAGDKYFVVIDGKKRGLVEITKAKGSKAIGRVVKGRAEADAEITPAAATASSSKRVSQDSEDRPKRSRARSKKRKDSDEGPADGIFWGGVVGLGLDNQSVTNPGTSQTVAMSGMGYNIRGFGDMPFTDQIGGIARVGLEQMNLSGSGGASTSIMYLAADILGRYDFMKGNFIPYVAGGMSLMTPMSQTSNVLGTIASVMTFLADGGIKYYLDSDMYIIGTAEYMYFPASSNVSTSLISVRGGLGLRF